MIKLAIVDDDEALATALKKELLEFSEIESIDISNGGIKFFKHLQQLPPEQRPQVIIMDISMGFPDEGIHATRLIKELFPDILIVMFTISDTDELIFDAFRVGAVGYLLKNEKPSFILKTILDVYNGGAQMSPSIARKAIAFLSPATNRSKLQKETAEGVILTDREFEILRLVEQGATYDNVADTLAIAPNTVKKHMMNIFTKLQVNNKIEAIKKAGL
ncbi:MAG: response regulator transcription factor [Bacteroidetes bacterium]|nr:response regulator transcription factor [Bacteroidota bacterium]